MARSTAPASARPSSTPPDRPRPPVTADQAEAARRAWRRFGKGNHPARLNFGGCFAYAFAKATGEPLLFKGEDFARTDIEAA